jgi:hypothetical protein
MSFDKATGLSSIFACVILADEKAAKAATQVLNNAPLFDMRVRVEAIKMDVIEAQKGYLNSGWIASKDSRPEHAILRALCFQRPTNVFQPVREGRRVGLDTLDIGSTIYPENSYKLLHDYNVMRVAKRITYTRKPVLQRRRCVFVDFATREEADEVVQIFNGAKFEGLTMEVSKYQIPMRHLGASWDGGLKGGHRSGRDQGSAVGTNYEHVSLFVVFILALMLGS